MTFAQAISQVNIPRPTAPPPKANPMSVLDRRGEDQLMMTEDDRKFAELMSRYQATHTSPPSYVIPALPAPYPTGPTHILSAQPAAEPPVVEKPVEKMPQLPGHGKGVTGPPPTFAPTRFNQVFCEHLVCNQHSHRHEITWVCQYCQTKCFINKFGVTRLTVKAKDGPETVLGTSGR